MKRHNTGWHYCVNRVEAAGLRVENEKIIKQLPESGYRMVTTKLREKIQNNSKHFLRVRQKANKVLYIFRDAVLFTLHEK